MAKRYDSKLLLERRNLRVAADALIRDLKTNDWPPDAKERPLTNLSGYWPELTPEQAEADPEKARRIEFEKAREQPCHKWRFSLRLFFENGRRYFNDYGDSDSMRRFESNKLVIVAGIDDPVFREMYTTEECVRDLESLKALVGAVGHVRRHDRRSPPMRRSRPWKSLSDARGAYGHTQWQAAETIGIPQGVMSQYESGTRKPNLVNRRKCADYIEKAPHPGSAG